MKIPVAFSEDATALLVHAIHETHLSAAPLTIPDLMSRLWELAEASMDTPYCLKCQDGVAEICVTCQSHPLCDTCGDQAAEVCQPCAEMDRECQATIDCGQSAEYCEKHSKKMTHEDH